VVVILSDGSYSVRKRTHEYTRDGHGTPVPGSPGSASAALPGAATEQPDGTYTLRLDPALWPLREDDLIDGPSSRTWIIESAVLRVNNADSAIDYVAVTAALQPPRRV
jgi:hypothetical protein